MRRAPIFVSLVLATTLPAAEFQSFDRTEQVDASDLVVLGTVESVRSAWTPDRRAAYTDAEVAVEESWKGRPRGARVTVRVPGGEVDGIVVRVDGAETLVPGERVVLFLREARDAYVVVGMRYGKYRVEPEGRSAYVTGPLPPSVPGSASHHAVSMSLEELRDRVREIGGGAR